MSDFGPDTMTADVDIEAAEMADAADELTDALLALHDAAVYVDDATTRFEETSVTIDTGHGEPTEIPANEIVGFEISIECDLEHYDHDYPQTHDIE